MSLPFILELILPLACAWAKWHESIILRKGVPLSDAQLRTARELGIRHPDRVRLLAVQKVPPASRLLQRAAQPVGLDSSQTIGMTLRYGIFIQESYWEDRRLLVHELAHVVQYERLGGFYGFLRLYLRECINPGYPLGDLEQEAKRAERKHR